MKKLHEDTSEVYLLKEPDPITVDEIKRQFSLTELTSKIIANRGLSHFQEISTYLSPKLKHIPDPFLFKDMHIAVERIYQAITNQEAILIYGDYDVDGITATALMVNFFKHLRYPVRHHIPNRFHDGYGLNLQSLQSIHKTSPFSLLITVDCGTSNDETIYSLKKLGVDTIVTDHHQSPERPPNAMSVLNPARPDCVFPYKELSGVGVAFFLLIALRKYLRDKNFYSKNDILEPDLRNFLDLVSIGTVADMVPVTGINRILITSGLASLPDTSRTGLKAFLGHLGLYGKKPISPWDIAFQIAPRFNAAGRLHDATTCVSLLTTESLQEATSIATELESLNAKRQLIEKELLEQIEGEIKTGSGFVSPFAMVLWNEGWHEGVIGIAASKLVEKFGKPVALIAFKEEDGKGSLRGVSETHIFEVLRQCHSLLDAYGGHPMAGGLRIQKKNLPQFCKTFSKAIEEQLNGILPKRRWLIDAVTPDTPIPPEFFSELPHLAPFGIGNPQPLLLFQDIRILSKRLLKEKHIKLSFKVGANPVRLSGIAFNTREDWETVERASWIIGVPTLNVWNGKVTPQINIKRFIYL